MKDKSTLQLASRLNQIMREQENLEIEYNKIVNELWQRIPKLKDDVNIQPKKKTRKYNDMRDKE